MKLRKILALLLALAMMLAVVPGTGAFAADETPDSGITDVPPTDEPETDEPEEDINIKGDVLTTADGKFEYYKYELTNETTGETSYILEIKAYLGSDKEVVISEKLDEDAASPYTVQIIGDEAFLDKSELLRVTLPETVTKIGIRAFCNCTSLFSINLPDSLKVIDNDAFNACQSINAIHMPAQIERIGANAFYGCVQLVGNAMIPSEVPNTDGTYSDVMALTFPSTLKYIGDGAFASCESLINVIIPEGIKAIYTGTFTNCFALEKVDIPYSVEYIGAAFNSAFTGHSRLSVYEPTLIIRNPHCVIEQSKDMDAHTVVMGVRYSLVNHMAEEGNYTFEAIDPPAQHNFSYSGVVTPPTCYDEGYTTYTCDCGLYNDFCITDYEPALGHRYGDWYLGGTGEGDENSIVDPEDVFVIGGDDNDVLGDILGGINGALGDSEDGSSLDDILGSITGALGGNGSGDGTTSSTVVSKKSITEEEFKAIQLSGKYKPFCTTGEEISRKCTACGHIEHGHKNPEGHKIYNVTTATCTEYGVVRELCAACGISLSQKTDVPFGHTWAEEKEFISEYKKCETSGVLRCTCLTCGEKFDEVTPAHTDADKDLVCDDCAVDLEKTDCSCNCHKTGFFWDFINKICVFVWKLFKISPRCACGIAHY